MTMAVVGEEKKTLADLGIVTDLEVLRKPCKVANLADLPKIIEKLVETFNNLKEFTDINPVGLAAPQIGINAKVAYVNVFRPIFIVNPGYIKRSGMQTQWEECISIPQKRVFTKRHVQLIINSQGKQMKFGFPVERTYDMDGPVTAKFVKGKPKFYVPEELIRLESVAVAHEIDHLNGVLITERVYEATIAEKIEAHCDKVIQTLETLQQQENIVTNT